MGRCTSFKVPNKEHIAKDFNATLDFRENSMQWTSSNSESGSGLDPNSNSGSGSSSDGEGSNDSEAKSSGNSQSDLKKE